MHRIAVAAAVLLSVACSARQRPLPSGAGEDRAGTTPAGAPRPGEIVREYDLNRDGLTDLWTSSVMGADGKETVVHKEKDLNGDGKVDCWEEYGPDGTLAKLTYDMDFDGKPDLTLFFEKDLLVRKAYAFGFDGVPHSFNIYEKGKLVRKERDTNGDGKIDTWEYWENGEVDRVGVDLDGDGQVDRWETHATAQAPEADAKPKD